MACILTACSRQYLAAALGAALLTAAAAKAETLTDPTRPPNALENTGTSAEAATAPAGLQSIIRSNQGKPAAIINGEYVVLGGHVGEARLVKIGEDSVTLKGAAGTETLKLIPGIEKTPRGFEEKGVPASAPGKKVKK